MVTLCGVDMSPQAFEPGTVAQTSAAISNVIAINLDPDRRRLTYRINVDHYKSSPLPN